MNVFHSQHNGAFRSCWNQTESFFTLLEVTIFAANLVHGERVDVGWIKLVERPLHTVFHTLFCPQKKICALENRWIGILACHLTTWTFFSLSSAPTNGYISWAKLRTNDVAVVHRNYVCVMSQVREENGNVSDRRQRQSHHFTLHQWATKSFDIIKRHFFLVRPVVYRRSVLTISDALRSTV